RVVRLRVAVREPEERRDENAHRHDEEEDEPEAGHYSALERAQMLMPLSVACRSISASSSSVKSGRSSAAMFVSSCSTLEAPPRADVTRESRNTQAMAIWASDCPRAEASSFSARTLAIASSVIRSGENDVFSLAREPSGMPCRYLSVSIPCARGEKAMQPTPSSASTSSSPSSIQRLSIEYDGWWMRSGVPRSRRIAAASVVFAAEYEEMPT